MAISRVRGRLQEDLVAWRCSFDALADSICSVCEHERLTAPLWVLSLHVAVAYGILHAHPAAYAEAAYWLPPLVACVACYLTASQSDPGFYVQPMYERVRSSECDGGDHDAWGRSPNLQHPPGSCSSSFPAAADIEIEMATVIGRGGAAAGSGATTLDKTDGVEVYDGEIDLEMGGAGRTTKEEDKIIYAAKNKTTLTNKNGDATSDDEISRANAAEEPRSVIAGFGAKTRRSKDGSASHHDDSQHAARRANRRRRNGAGLRWCEKCGIYQPLRTKHCRDCGRCVRTHDHHCPWIGTCVGEGNRRAFFFFLLFQFLELVQFAEMGVRVFRHGEEMHLEAELGPDLRRYDQESMNPQVGMPPRPATVVTRTASADASPAPDGNENPLPLLLKKNAQAEDRPQTGGDVKNGDARQTTLYAEKSKPVGARGFSTQGPLEAQALQLGAALPAQPQTREGYPLVAPEFVRRRTPDRGRHRMKRHIMTRGQIVGLLISLSLVGVFLIMVGGLLCFHTWLISMNLTTWETSSWHRISYLKTLDEDLGSPFSRGLAQNFMFFFCPRRARRTVAYEGVVCVPAAATQKCAEDEFSLDTSVATLDGYSVWVVGPQNNPYSVPGFQDCGERSGAAVADRCCCCPCVQ